MADMTVNVEWSETLLAKVGSVADRLDEAMEWVRTAHDDDTDAAQYSGYLMAMAAITVELGQLIKRTIEGEFGE